jgi:hypothetical protein
MKKEVYIDSVETVGQIRKTLSSFNDECEIGFLTDDGVTYDAVSVTYEIETKTGIGRIRLN